MNSLEEIRERDSNSAETWFKTPALGACGRAFIDRRWLLAEIDRLRGTLSLAEEGLVNYAQEVEQLRSLLRQWQFDVGGAMDALERETLAAINAEPQVATQHEKSK